MENGREKAQEAQKGKEGWTFRVFVASEIFGG
jgi:hypothetical protein